MRVGLVVRAGTTATRLYLLWLYYGYTYYGYTMVGVRLEEPLDHGHRHPAPLRRDVRAGVRVRVRVRARVRVTSGNDTSGKGLPTLRL